MTRILINNALTTEAVSEMIDCFGFDPMAGVFSSELNGAVREVIFTWPTSFRAFMEGQQITLAAGHIHLNTADVTPAATYYVYCDGTSGTPTITSSTLQPATNAAVTEYFVMAIIRFSSVGGTLVVYFSKLPSQDGIYETIHNLKEDVVFTNPAWISGHTLTMSAGGKLSTTEGYCRFSGNPPRILAAITEGAFTLDDETIVAGTDSITTYDDGSPITAGSYVKLLVGILRNRANVNTSKFIIMRQAKPAVEYATAAAATADAEGAAAAGFPNTYLGAVTPIYYITTLKGDYTDGGAQPGGILTDIRASGLTGGGGGGAAASDHSTLSNLNVLNDHMGYVTVNGLRDLTGDWSITKSITTTADVTADQLVSTIAIGTKPIDVTSTTVCTNLNADAVDGIQGANILTADGNTALTGNWAAAKNITTVGDMGSVNFTASGLAKADTFQSTHAIGVAPYTATSTTVCTNVNADAVDGIQGANIVTADGLTSLSAAWDAGPWQVRAETFQSDIATIAGAPFVVASTALVTNLNADTVDGLDAAAFAVSAKGVTNGDTHDHAGGDGAQIAHSGLSGLTAPADDHTQYLLADGTRALSGNWNAGTKSITTTSSVSGSQLVSTIADGGASPLTVTSKTKTTNLNADMLDGLHDTSFLKADGSVQLTGNMLVTGGVTIDGVDISAHAQNINAHHTIATLSVAADTVLSLTDQDIGLDTQTANRVWAGPTTGAAAVPTFRALVAADIDIARTQGTLTLTDGQNNNVALTDGVSEYVVTGPTAAFGISGFTGGIGGRTVRILNNTIAKAMTAYHQTGSTAANQIFCSGSQSDTATASYGIMTFTYFATLQRWVLVSMIA